MKRSIVGKVIAGKGLGTKLGFPTANIATRDPIIQEDWGIYIGVAHFENNALPCAIHIGQAKTFGDNVARVEAHILDWKKDVRGLEMKIEVLQKIRDTEKFDTPDELIKRIREDIQETRSYFKNNSK